MSLLLGILVALIVIGVCLWGINAILGVVPIPEPFKTILWVIVVIVAVLTVGVLLAKGVIKAADLPSLFRLLR